MRRVVMFSMAPVHIPAFYAFMKSLKKHNPWFSEDVIILETGFTEKWKKEVRKIYSNVQFRKPKYGYYEHIRRDIGVIRMNYYKLEAYSYEFDRIIMMDTDMIVCGDIKELLDTHYPICFCNRYDSTNDRMIPHLNGGLAVINKLYLNDKVYRELLKKATPGHQFTEQCVQDKMWEGKYHVLEKKWNVEKRMMYTKNNQYKDIWNKKRILHFIGPKPWEKYKGADGNRFLGIEKEWHKYDGFKKDQLRVMVIANGPNIRKNCGKEIDKFHVVIRVNNFKVKGYEKDVGTKTNYIIMGYCIPYCQDLFDYNPGIFHVFCGEHNGFTPHVRKRVGQDHADPRFKGCRLPLDKMNCLDEYYFYGLRMKVGLTGQQRATTGLVAIDWAMNNFPFSDISIMGFNFFKDGGHHYFDYKTNPNHFHDHGREEFHIQGLIEKGLIHEF